MTQQVVKTETRECRCGCGTSFSAQSNSTTWFAYESCRKRHALEVAGFTPPAPKSKQTLSLAVDHRARAETALKQMLPDVVIKDSEPAREVPEQPPEEAVAAPRIPDEHWQKVADRVLAVREQNPTWSIRKCIKESGVSHAHYFRAAKQLGIKQPRVKQMPEIQTEDTNTSKQVRSEPRPGGKVRAFVFEGSPEDVARLIATMGV